MTDTFPAKGAAGDSRRKITNPPDQAAWNRRHEALAKYIWEEGAPMTPTEARLEASRRMRAAGDTPPLEAGAATGGP